MARTFTYQNKIILILALGLLLLVTGSYLKKKGGHFLYVEVVHHP